MKRTLAGAVLLAFLIVISQSSPIEAATPLPGAVFTTVADGTIVNANTQYVSKCAVYLDGGPGPKAPAKAAGLPSGDYFFQVTDPSGETLLSTDVVNNRRFHVSNGVITAYTGTGGPAHLTGMDQVHPELGTITISLANLSCPTDFPDTPNAGGVYKAWVTPVANFVGDPTQVDNPCGNVSESQNGYQTLGLIFNGNSLPPQPIYAFSWKAGDPSPTLVFQNWSMLN
jgi:hypothetical protein